jgi:hypothetical protein
VLAHLFPPMQPSSRQDVSAAGVKRAYRRCLLCCQPAFFICIRAHRRPLCHLPPALPSHPCVVIITSFE